MCAWPLIGPHAELEFAQHCSLHDALWISVNPPKNLTVLAVPTNYLKCMYIMYCGHREHLKNFGHPTPQHFTDGCKRRMGMVNRQLHKCNTPGQNAKIHPTSRCLASHPATLPACCYVSDESGECSSSVRMLDRSFVLMKVICIRRHPKAESCVVWG